MGNRGRKGRKGEKLAKGESYDRGSVRPTLQQPEPGWTFRRVWRGHVLSVWLCHLGSWTGNNNFTTRGGIASTSTGAKSPNCWPTRLAKTFRLCHRGEHRRLTKLLSSASGPLSASSTWAFSGVPKVASCLLREKSSNKKSLSLFVLSEEEMDEAFCRDVESFSPAYTPRIKIQGWEEGISQLEMINVRTEGGVHTFIIHVLFGQVFVRTERETRQLPYNPYTSLRIAVWQVMLYLFPGQDPQLFSWWLYVLCWLHNFPCSAALAPPPAGGWKYLMEPRNPWVIGPQTTNTGNWWTKRILHQRFW